MMQRTYQAHFFDEGAGRFSVTFHDLPGCITSGSSFDEAKLMSVEVLQFFIDGLVDDAEEVPEPTRWMTPLRQNETLVEVQVRVPRYGHLAFPIGFLKRQTEEQRAALLAVFSMEEMNHIPTDAEFEVVLTNLNVEIEITLEQRIGVDHRTLADELRAGRQETTEMCELLMLVDCRDEAVARRERQAKAGMVPSP